VTRQSRQVWYELTFPANLPAEAAISFMRSLASRGRAGWLSPLRPIVFELRANKAGVRWLVGLPEEEARRLQASLENWLPGLAVAPVAVGQSGGDLAVELRLRSQRRPLRSELQPEISRALLGGLVGLRGQEQVVVQWVVGGWLPRSAVPPSSDQGAPPSIWNIAEWGAPRLTTEETTEARKKQAEQLFACVGRVAVSAATAKRQRSLVTRVVGAYQLFRVSGSGLSRRSLPSWLVSSRMARSVVNQIDPPSVMRADELVAVLGWPIGLDENTSLPGVELNRSKLLRPDRRVLRPKELADQRVVAESAYPSAKGNLVLSPDAGRRHLHVFGPTGVGKSTLLSHLIRQDIEAGHGVVVVDPKGDLVDDTVTRLSADALKRVVVLDPSDQAPVGLNPLASIGRGSGGVAVDGLLGVLHSLWASSWGPRLHDVLHAGLLTLAINDQKPGHSLVELPLLLTNPTFRRPLVARASAHDPLGLGSFWAWFDGLSDEQTAQVLGPVMNKLRAFILRPDLRAVLGQNQPRFSVQQVFAERRSLLVRLPKGELGGESAALLGSLVVQQVWQATLARSAVPARSRHPVFVYLDEFQEVVRLPLDLGDALAQARGLGVGLVLAHQHLGQLGTDLRAGVLANAGSRVAFRLDHEDASTVAKRSGGKLSPDDFSSLPPFDAYADLVAEGAARGFASARTRPLGPAIRSVDSVRSANRRAWGVPRAETEAHLRALLEGPANNSSSGRSGTSGGGFGVIPDSGGGT
jgi:hypothetical protein